MGFLLLKKKLSTFLFFFGIQFGFMFKSSASQTAILLDLKKMLVDSHFGLFFSFFLFYVNNVIIFFMFDKKGKNVDIKVNNICRVAY